MPNKRRFRWFIGIQRCKSIFSVSSAMKIHITYIIIALAVIAIIINVIGVDTGIS